MKPLLLFCLLVLLSSYNQPVKTFPPSKKDCFSGKWGNDFIMCGKERVNKSGKGNGGKRNNEELWLTFQGKDKGEFSFYDCQQEKRFKDGVPFTYILTGDSIRFSWQGNPSEIRVHYATFNFKTIYHVDCREDTVIFKDLMSNTAYHGATYFIRRK